MSKQNTIIKPANYTVEVKILFDPMTGLSEILSTPPINPVVMIQLLTSHCNAIATQMIQEQTKSLIKH